MKTRFFQKVSRTRLACLLGVAAACSPILLWAGPQGQDGLRVETLKTHSRLLIQLDESTQTEWKTTPGGFELVLKGLGLGDLGAPLGEEAQWSAAFTSLKDPRLQGLQLSETAAGVKIVGKWKFPTGAAALAEPGMESFQYRDKSPAQLIVDFWLKKGPTLAEIQAAKRQTERLAAMKKSEEEARNRVARAIASEKARAVQEDVGRFCRDPMTEASDVFLTFTPFHEEVNYGAWVANTTPDSNFFYFEPKTKDRDAQYVRLALELYRQGKTALVLRTLDFFDAEHPQSPYRSEMTFLRANALLKLGMQREAQEVLTRIMTQSPEAPVALHSALFIATQRATQKSHLSALEPFLWLISRYPDHRLNWLFHLGAAESFYGLKQTERAAKEYQWVMEHAQERAHQAEAAIRRGDLYMDRGQYEQGLAAYFQGLNYFEKESEKFPSIYLNRAESLFGLGQLDRAKEAFENFLKRFPAHPQGWRATYRLGEIAGRKGDAKYREHMSETINHYPFSAGATLARVRLVPCDDHMNLGFEAIEKFFAGEASNFDGKGEVIMTRYPEFKALAQIRTYISFERFDLAVNTALQTSLSYPNAETRPVLVSMLQVLFRKHLLNLLAQGRKYDAIAFYSEKSKLLPKDARYAEPGYLLKLSQAASDLGLGKVAGELTQAYQTALSKNSERGLAAAIEESSDPAQKLKVSEQRFSEAKALWISSGMAAEAQIRVALASVGEESAFSFEREVILGLMDEKKGKLESALSHVAKAQLLKPSGSKFEIDLRLESWLASLEARAGDPKVALEMNRTLESHVSAAGREQAAAKESSSVLGVLGVPPVSPVSRLILTQAEILDRLNRWGEAAATYERAIESGSGGNQAKYGYARALLKSGAADERTRGLAILKEIATGKTEDYWKKLAASALGNAEVTRGKSVSGDK